MTQKYASPVNAFEQIASNLVRKLRDLPLEGCVRFDLVEDVTDMSELFAEVARMADQLSDPLPSRRVHLTVSAGFGR